MTTTTTQRELQDLHAVRSAETAALREMLGPPGNNGSDHTELRSRLRATVTEILRLQQAMSRLDS